jgi:hypothetical protein
MQVTCPVCSSEKARHDPKHPVQVYICNGCGCVHGTCYLGESYSVVRNQFHPQAATFPVENERHYDLTCLGSEGISRRHGKFDPATRFILQTG